MYLFFLIQNNKAFQNKNSIPNTVSTAPALDERLLKKVKDTFAERAHITEIILQNPPSYTDPSL